MTKISAYREALAAAQAANTELRAKEQMVIIAAEDQVNNTRHSAELYQSVRALRASRKRHAKAHAQLAAFSRRK